MASRSRKHTFAHVPPLLLLGAKAGRAQLVHEPEVGGCPAEARLIQAQFLEKLLWVLGSGILGPGGVKTSPLGAGAPGTTPPAPSSPPPPPAGDPAPEPGLMGFGGGGVAPTPSASDPAPAPAEGNMAPTWPSTGGLTGSAFLRQTAGLSPAEREAAILEAARAGHVPAFLGRFAVITLESTGPSGATHRAQVRMSPDYFAIGTDQDFVRMPMRPGTAQAIADHFGAVLPRPRLVDSIWQQAPYQLRPRPLSPGPPMSSNEYYARANRLVDAELAGRPLGPLTAGAKKDIVVTNRLARRPGRVAIYGWHRTNGRPIQSLSLVHGADYVDYSHGLRLVARELVVDGRTMDIEQVLADPELAGLLSAERPVSVTRYP